MSSDKPLSPLLKVLIYIGVVLLAIVLVVIICIAVMFFVPGTSILGYQYVNYSSNTDHVFTLDTPLSISDVYAIEVTSDVAGIYIYPNENSNEIKITHNQGVTGFTKSITSELSVNAEVMTRSFENDTSSHKTLVFTVSEPSGFMLNNHSYICVYVPSNLNLTTIYAKSGSGNIVYNTKGPKKTSSNNTNPIEPFVCSNLYLKSAGAGNIYISNPEQVENYYISTKSGALTFSELPTPFSANTIKFETETGLFSFVNKTQDATLTLHNELFIKSNKQSGLGPQIRVNNLLGNLRIETFNGYYNFNKIGEGGNNKLVAITTNNSRVKLDEVYGQVSILGDADNVSNNIDIQNLVGGSNVNNLDAGSGSIYIKSLSGDTALNSTSGQIKVDSATPNSNIWAHSTSGNIIIRYEESEESFSSKKTTVLTNTGNIDLGYVSNAVDVTVLSKNSSTLNLTFSAIATTDNYINAGNCNIDIVLVGTSDSLQHRIASTNRVTIPQTAVGAAGSEIETTDADYFIDNAKYNSYSYNYRIGYAKDNVVTRPYDNWGKLLITTTGSTTVRTLL